MASAMGGRGSPRPDSAPPRAVCEEPSAMARSDRRFETLTHTSPVPANPAQNNASEIAGKSVPFARTRRLGKNQPRYKPTPELFWWDFLPFALASPPLREPLRN